MGQGVTSMGAPNPHKYTQCIPHRQRNQSTILKYTIEMSMQNQLVQ